MCIASSRLLARWANPQAGKFFCLGRSFAGNLYERKGLELPRGNSMEEMGRFGRVML